MSVDPVRPNANTGDHFNQYVYAINNPFRYIDPDGRQVIVITGRRTPTPAGNPFDSPVGLSPTSKVETPSTPNMAIVACIALPVICATSSFLEEPKKNGVKQSVRPLGAIDAKRGARKCGQKDGINPDRAEDRFHDIKQSDSGPASGAKDDLSVNPDTGEVFDANGEHIGNLNDKG
jgi:hypothetical protein